MLAKCGIITGKCSKECAYVSVEENTECGCACQMVKEDCASDKHHFVRTCVSVSAGILKQEEAVLTRRGLGQSKTALVGVQRCILALVAVPTPTPHAPVPWR